MNTPTPVEIAIVAAPIYAAMKPARASVTDAVVAARQLIKAASAPEKPYTGESRKNTEEAAKNLGYVSRNWRNQFRKFCIEKWGLISERMPAVVTVSCSDGGAFFDFYDKQTWDDGILKRLRDAKATSLTLAHKRPKNGQQQSVKKKPSNRRK